LQKHSSVGGGNGTSSGNGFSVLVELLRPDSSGSVQLDSPNPFTAPRINPSYLASQKDVNMMISGKTNITVPTTPFWLSIYVL